MDPNILAMIAANPSMSGAADLFQQNQAFGQQAFGAPMTPDNMALLQQSNQALPDPMREIEDAYNRYQPPPQGYLQRFASGLPAMRGNGDFFTNLLAGAANSWGGRVRGEAEAGSEKTDFLRTAASNMAKARWEKAYAQRNAAQQELEQRGRQESTQKASAARQATAIDARKASVDRRTVGVQTPEGEKRLGVRDWLKRNDPKYAAPTKPASSKNYGKMTATEKGAIEALAKDLGAPAAAREKATAAESKAKSTKDFVNADRMEAASRSDKAKSVYRAKKDALLSPVRNAGKQAVSAAEADSASAFSGIRSTIASRVEAINGMTNKDEREAEIRNLAALVAKHPVIRRTKELTEELRKIK